MIETKIKKFIKCNLERKFFITGLFMALNSNNKKTIERAKVLTVSVLPLMFENERFREQVEQKILDYEKDI